MYMGVFWNRGTPSYHPFPDGIFPSTIPRWLGVAAVSELETPIDGHWNRKNMIDWDWMGLNMYIETYTLKHWIGYIDIQSIEISVDFQTLQMNDLMIHRSWRKLCSIATLDFQRVKGEQTEKQTIEKNPLGVPILHEPGIPVLNQPGVDSRCAMVLEGLHWPWRHEGWPCHADSYCGMSNMSPCGLDGPCGDVQLMENQTEKKTGSKMVVPQARWMVYFRENPNLK